MKKGLIVAGFLLKAHQQLSEAVEPRVRGLDDPAPSFLVAG